MQKKLLKAVIKQLGGEENRGYAIQASRHGADGGFPGFTMTYECVEFAKKYRDEIVYEIVQVSDSCDENIIGFMRNWKYLKDVHELSIAAALTGGKWDKDEVNQVLEQMAWFALEEAGNAMDE